eukprot:1051822-Amphidinium_carterae.2
MSLMCKVRVCMRLVQLAGDGTGGIMFDNVRQCPPNGESLRGIVMLKTKVIDKALGNILHDISLDAKH